jgi:hypothetical protein
MYLTVYLTSDKSSTELSVDSNHAKEIFKYLWDKFGTGFDHKGNIKGLYEYYLRCDWDDDAEKLKAEKGQLKILKLASPDRGRNYSFNFHNYGGETKLNEKVDLRDIYLTLAEILSCCFAYPVKVSDSYDDKEYSAFFSEDGRKYVMIEEDRSEYIKTVRDVIYAKSSISDNTKKLTKSEDRLKEMEQKLDKYEKESGTDE